MVSGAPTSGLEFGGCDFLQRSHFTSKSRHLGITFVHLALWSAGQPENTAGWLLLLFCPAWAALGLEVKGGPQAVHPCKRGTDSCSWTVRRAPPPDARHTAARIQKADRSARLGSSAETVEAVAEGEVAAHNARDLRASLCTRKWGCFVQSGFTRKIGISGVIVLVLQGAEQSTFGPLRERPSREIL